LEIGVYQFIIYSNLLPASFRWDESDALNFRLEVKEQFICQVHGPVSLGSGGILIAGNMKR
jgi:hypothetical protein